MQKTTYIHDKQFLYLFGFTSTGINNRTDDGREKTVEYFETRPDRHKLNSVGYEGKHSSEFRLIIRIHT